MSLFQIRSWWEVKCGSEEEFDVNHLVVGNVDNEPNNSTKIVAASINGKVRIYLPLESEYKIEHLILEQDLNQPILQIAKGYFASNDRGLYLAVLHPRQLCIYAVTAFGGWGIHAQYYQLTLKYSHNLDRNAFNFIYGTFGKQQHFNSFENANMSNNGGMNDIKLDSICVQSIDGKFWIFEQESFAFSRDWNNFIVPGCMHYVPETDCLLMMSADMKLYCYKYVTFSTNANTNQNLNQFNASSVTTTMNINSNSSNSSNNVRDSSNLIVDDSKEASNKPGQKSVDKTWSLNVGDHGMYILVTRFRHDLSMTDLDIILLCEKYMFAISLNGMIRWQHKLDYNPSCMVAYPVATNMNNNNQNDMMMSSHINNVTYNLIVATFQNSIHIYSNCNLMWSARLGFSPIDISVASIGGIDGMQVLLSETGELFVGYLGTDQTGYTPVHIDNRELNYDRIESEMRQVKKDIKKIESNKLPMPDDTLHCMLEYDLSSVHWSETQGYMTEQFNNEIVVDSTGRVKCWNVRLIIKYIDTSSKNDSNMDQKEDRYGVDNIQIVLDSDPAFPCSQSQICIPQMNLKNDEMQFDLTFYCRKTKIPHLRECQFYITYFNENDKMQVCQSVIPIPFNLCVTVRPPIKNTKYVLTFELTNFKNIPMPTQLFSDMIDNEPSIEPEIMRTPQALTMIFHANNSDVTILLSRKGGRIRVQSGTFGGMWYIMDEVVDRLQKLKNDYDMKKQQSSGNDNNKKNKKDGTETGFKQEPLSIILKDNLPFEDYFEQINNRWNIREDMKQSELLLENLSKQYKMIQKRLLARYRDKNPTPLNKMDILLKQTYKNIIHEANNMEKLELKHKQLTNELIIATKLMWRLIKIKFKFDDANEYLLKSYLPICYADDEILEGWEEQLEACMVFVLRTCLAKSRKDAGISQHVLGKMRDVSKLERHMKIVFDRLGKGQKFTDRPNFK